jgi:hypothetical protein
MSDMKSGDVVVMRKRPWWAFWRPKYDAIVCARGSDLPISDVVAVFVDGKLAK